MHNNSYIYSVLQYKHSQYTGEAVNVGVLLFWPKTSQFIFDYSKNLSRIKHLYLNFSDKIILEYLKLIENRCVKLNKSDFLFLESEIEGEFSDFINDYIFGKSSNALQFSKPVKSINYFEDPILVINNLLENHYIQTENKKEPRIQKENILFKKYVENLTELGLDEIIDIDKKVRRNVIVRNETGAEFKFDLGWQNGSFNLVRSLNFDLHDQKQISEKAYKNYGLFTDLGNEAVENNYRYDLLLTTPTNKDFFKDYDHALKLLGNLDNVKLVPENDILKYSEYTIEQLLKDIM